MDVITATGKFGIPLSRWAIRPGDRARDRSRARITQPAPIVCGDSNLDHGAFGALAFGIGTSEVEHVLATQTLPQTKPGTMEVNVDGRFRGRTDAGDDREHDVLAVTPAEPSRRR